MTKQLDLVWIQTAAGPKRVWRTRQEQRQSWLRGLGTWSEHIVMGNVALAAFIWKFCKPLPSDRGSAN